MAGKVEDEDEVDGVQDAVMQVDVRTVLQSVELGVGDLRVIKLQRSRSVGPRTTHRRRCRGARQQVAYLRIGVEFVLGVSHHARWLQKQTAIRVFAHHKALIGTAGQHCAAAVIGFYDDKYCRFSHYTSVANIPIMGTRCIAPYSRTQETAPRSSP